MTDKPDGSMTAILYEHFQQTKAVNRHCNSEGIDVGTMTVLESYDRTLHPWLHGRRPADLIQKLKTWWSE